MPYFKSSSGLRIYYEVTGEKGPWLVFMHGLASSTEIWHYQVDYFKQEYRILCWDFPGHGKSDSRIFHNMRFYQEMLVELMDHLDIRKAHLSALSAGCCAAMLCAINHPERVSSLIIQGPVGGLIPPWHPKAWLKMAILLIYLCTLSILALSVGKKRTAELVNKVPAQTRDYVPLLPELECKISPFAKFFLTMEIAHPPYIGKLECIKTPTLVIYGEEDPFPRRYFEYVYDHISGIKRLQLIPKGRHVVMVDKPQEFNEACQAFLGFVESLQQA